ncbi:MAG: hypothetical protein EBZ49_16625 [Proteobacteria bacterium]|nr:hypothetical protein [Pseudomonadota bacterium]
MGKVLHASYSGYFPFCLKEGQPPETGIGTSYPISLPLNQYMSWWWKVKTWRLTGTSVGNETANSGDNFNYWTTTSLNDDEQWTSGIEKEESLICSSTRFIGDFTNNIGFNGESLYQENGGTPSTIVFSNNWRLSFLSSDVYLDGKTIYPNMIVSGWFNSQFPGDQKVQEQVDPYSFFYIDGIQIPCYINWFPAWTPYGDWAWTGSQIFNLDPLEYWSYGGTWNTSTGLGA